REGVFELAAEPSAHLGEHETVDERQQRELPNAEALASALLRGGLQRFLHEELHWFGARRELLLHRRVDLVEDARHAEEQRGLHLGEVIEDTVDALAYGHRAPVERGGGGSTVCPKTWAHGRKERERAANSSGKIARVALTFDAMLACVKITPFGFPVVPLV